MAVPRTSCSSGLRRGRGLAATTFAVGLGLAASSLLTARVPPAAAASPGPRPDDPVAGMIATYRERIPELMAEQDIPGVAVAVVDRDGLLWTEGFGDRDDDGNPVTPDTAFGMQSVSKLFTATAVMQAVEAGRLDLDEPITTYLPDFTVHSAFQDHPERRITLRMLLSHTAGFTHEAPVGNSNELDPGTFEEHVRSISDTWLRFPVGTGFAYSNLGIDLAGHVLEQVEGRPFADVVRDSLLAPLGMDRSTFDRAEIVADDDRAIPHVDHFDDPPLYEPVTAAGGLYSSAGDVARFLRFQLGAGVLDGRSVLAPELMREMRTIPAPFAGEQAGYALGVSRSRWDLGQQEAVLLDHMGGGSGFLSELRWVPELGIGAGVLTNSDDHDLQGHLAQLMLDALVLAPGIYQDRALALPPRDPVVEPPWLRLPADMATLVATAAMPATSDRADRWAGYVGAYRAPDWGLLNPFGPPERFLLDDGGPVFETQLVDETDSPVRHRLVEVERGVFLADNGETLDLSGSVPRWRGFRLVRVTEAPAAWQWVVLGVAALISVTWLVVAAGSAVRRAPYRSAPSRAWRRTAAAAATVTALLVLASVALLVWTPGLVYSGFLGGLALPTPLRLLLHVPLALVVLAAGTATITATGWVRRWWSRRTRIRYAALSAAAVAVSALLLGWGLVGWGLT